MESSTLPAVSSSSASSAHKSPSPDLSEESWYRRCLDHFGPVAARRRPVPQKWFNFWLSNLKLDASRGNTLARKLSKTIEDLLVDSMTTMQELVLSGDVENVDYQIRRELDRMSTDSERKFDLSSQNSLMQFAVLTGNPDMVCKVHDKGGPTLLNKPDLVTSFTALHFAFFVQDRRMIELLLRLGADIDQRDAFFATPVDYARMLRIVPPGYIRHSRNDLSSPPPAAAAAASAHPDAGRQTAADQLAQPPSSSSAADADDSASVPVSTASRPPSSAAATVAAAEADASRVLSSLERLNLTASETDAAQRTHDATVSPPTDGKADASRAADARLLGVSSLQVFNRARQALERLPVAEFERQFGVEFCPFLLCDEVYIEELMFSGFSIGTVDNDFRKRYFPQIYESSGDENLVLAFISDEVGYGVFAAKDFAEGDYVVRYGGLLTAAAASDDQSYTMSSGLEGVGLDARRHRNLAGMINHSSTAFNAESQCVFDRGAEQAVIVAVKPIARGQQVLIDYSKNYWSKKMLKSKRLEDLSAVAPLPI